MNKNFFSKILLCIMALLILFVIIACPKSDDKGACVRGSGITAGCGDDFTKGECSMINGSFHEGDSCSDLGFR